MLVKLKQKENPIAHSHLKSKIKNVAFRFIYCEQLFREEKHLNFLYVLMFPNKTERKRMSHTIIYYQMALKTW